MTDIVDRLQAYAVANDACGLYIEANCVYDAIEEIQRLRAALKKIGFDYVEFSHEKVQYLYLEHMQIARDAYQKSFPPDTDKPSDSPLDDNF
jgi:uncharacterized protein (DUF302 family)